MSEPNKKAKPAQDPLLGQEGVTDSPFDLPADKDSYEKVKEAQSPTAVATPTSPDDDKNTRRAQTENMNAHIPQAVPPDF